MSPPVVLAIARWSRYDSLPVSKNAHFGRPLQLLISDKRLAARASNALNNFIELINEMSGKLDELPLVEQAENAIQHSGLIDMHRREKGERGQARVENLEELVNACRNFEPEDGDAPVLPQFLDQVALDAGDRQANEDQDAVQLMTLHSAKRTRISISIYCRYGRKLIPA